VRVFKTRALAATACRAGHVTVDGQSVKPSRVIRGDELVLVRKPLIEVRMRVVAVLEKRVGAKAVPDYMQDLTPEEAREAAAAASAVRRAAKAENPETGRPSKRQRRKIEAFLDEVSRGAEDR
jgi:ribosome-associated heat shock protein Hsp15